jgi:hypothetical protein
MQSLRVASVLRSSSKQARLFSTSRPAQTKVAVLGAAGTSSPFRNVQCSTEPNLRLGSFDFPMT